MQISTNTYSMINSLPSSDASSMRIKKAMEVTENNGGVLSLMNNANSTTPSDKAISSWGTISLNLGADGKGIQIDDMAKIAEMAMKDAKSQLDAAFSEAGISNNPPVTFTFDLQGGLVVGDHPQKEKIQDILKNNETLTNNVREAMILKENAVSWQKAAIFTDAYQSTYGKKGAAAALALFDRYMSLGNPKTSFTYGKSGLQALFDGKSDQQYLASVTSFLGVGSGISFNGAA